MHITHYVVDALAYHDQFGVFGFFETGFHGLQRIGQLHRLDLIAWTHTLAQLHRSEFHDILEQLYFLLHVFVGFVLVSIFRNIIVQIDGAEFVFLAVDLHT